MPDQSEVTDLENEIAELQRTIDDLRRQVGGRSDGVGDPEDTAAALQGIQENEAILGTLQARLAGLQGDTA